MIFEKVAQLLADQFDIDASTVTADTSFVDDLKADSLDVVELIMAIEEEFEVEIPDELLESVRTVGDVVGYLEENAN